jgi:hypothetical protein
LAVSEQPPDQLFRSHQLLLAHKLSNSGGTHPLCQWRFRIPGSRCKKILLFQGPSALMKKLSPFGHHQSVVSSQLTADSWQPTARLSLVISRDLSETLPHAIWFVNAGELPSFTISITWLVAVWKPQLPHLHGGKGGVKEWSVIRSLTGRELLTTRWCFTLRGVGLNGFLDASSWFPIARRYDRLLTIPNRPSLPFHRQGVSPQNLLALSGRFPLHNLGGPL